ncbi:MAG TPA: hypothetical protein VLH79_06605 [Chthonomonadales bacterium]|nr:hypothetical protein [Chthonomonadales bacterium]
MRTDRMTSLRQRLQREAEAFEFDALIAGVSTIDAEEPQDAVQAAAAPVPTVEAPDKAAASERPADTTDPGADPVAQVVGPQARREGGGHRRAKAPRSERSLFLYGDPTRRGPDHADGPVRQEPLMPAARADRRPVSRAADREERLRTVLDTLGGRLLLEAGRMRAAVLGDDADLAGFHLAHINQLLDILQSVDPAGDLARQLGTRAAPPDGRTWPAATWSAVELAESPLSGLLPPTADGAYYRQLLRAAWGASRPS